jgi:hypothetical protein
MGLSHLFQTLGCAPFDAEEAKVGCQAGGMLAYQYGMYLDGRVVFGLWSAGVTIPRVTELFLRWRERAKERSTSAADINKSVARTVEGAVTARSA